jgi:sulfate adenylyltransferase
MLKSNLENDNLVQLIVDEQRAAVLKALSMHLPSITLNDHQLCDIELLATGAFSPLTGFMTRPDYEAVLDRMQLQDGTPWPIPICLGISEKQQRVLEAGQSLAIRDPEGFLLAVMHIEEIWPIDKAREAEASLGTTDRLHPWVHYLYTKEGEYYAGGKLEVLSLPLHYDFRQIRLTPHEVRTLYQKLGWKRIVGFQTRHPVHRAQFEIMLQAMRQARANLLLLPIVGLTLPDDLDYYTRVRCYQEVRVIIHPIRPC